MAKRRRVRLKTPPLLFEKTQAVLRRIRPRVEGTFLTYWTSTSGSVCDNDVMAHARHPAGARRRRRRITLFVKSDGGSGMASLRMVHLLRRYTRRLTVLAPAQLRLGGHHAGPGRGRASRMGPLSYLTAVDTSLEHDLSPLDHTNKLVAVSNDEVERVIRLWKETRGPRAATASTRTRSCTSTSTPWSSAPRPREQPVADALPRDPRLPHEGHRRRRSASAAS